LRPGFLLKKLSLAEGDELTLLSQNFVERELALDAYSREDNARDSASGSHREACRSFYLFISLNASSLNIPFQDWSHTEDHTSEDTHKEDSNIDEDAPCSLPEVLYIARYQAIQRRLYIFLLTL
jgi:hypothetical protein